VGRHAFHYRNRRRYWHRGRETRDASRRATTRPTSRGRGLNSWGGSQRACGRVSAGAGRGVARGDRPRGTITSRAREKVFERATLTLPAVECVTQCDACHAARARAGATLIAHMRALALFWDEEPLGKRCLGLELAPVETQPGHTNLDSRDERRTVIAS
jgi:hypothetical protein